ncbi:hypothetical protein U9M48_035660 [Paspalum notatum var. saurae]|uniref:Uncharacterized protein n=1 Tax=Paspalum notatum var. saurae TaxID=547442 RepID=A0AAQ3XA84_PASNO
MRDKELYSILELNILPLMIQAWERREIPLPNSALNTHLDTRGTLSTMLRESFTSPHYTLYHYIDPLIHTSQGRSKGVFIVLSDGEAARLEVEPGDLVPSWVAWLSLGSTASLHPTVDIAPPRLL